MQSSRSNDRYLRTMRALAMIGTVGVSASCASVVVPGADGAVADTGTNARDVRADETTVVDTGTCPAGCPLMRPAEGSACRAMDSCDYPNSDGTQTFCYCNTSPSSVCGTFRCSTAVPGPLPPPDLAAV